MACTGFRYEDVAIGSNPHDARAAQPIGEQLHFESGWHLRNRGGWSRNRPKDIGGRGRSTRFGQVGRSEMPGDARLIGAPITERVLSLKRRRRLGHGRAYQSHAYCQRQSDFVLNERLSHPFLAWWPW